MAIFLNENVARGLSQNAAFQVGKSDVDRLGNSPEQDVQAGWLINPDISWVEYECWIESYLDSGIAIHRPLPQSAQQVDSLAASSVDDPDFAQITTGVNLTSKARYKNITQRMATSVYRFCLKGYAKRVGYRIPIPSLKSVGGVPAVPDDEQPQAAYNRMVGNNGGVPIFFAEWALWYTVAVPPREEQLPPSDLAEHITAEDQLPTGIQVPLTVPDSEAVNTQPPQLFNPIRG
jgi:hypothetical protein